MKKWTKTTICNDVEYLHPLLRDKVAAVISDVQAHFDSVKVKIKLFETGRSAARQVQLVKNGTSKTMNSKHLKGRAADIVPFVLINKRWTPTWSSIKGNDGRTVWELITSSAESHGLDRVWFNGKNGKYVDGPHVSLPDTISDEYPGW